jgi:hypothetical protein
LSGALARWRRAYRAVRERSTATQTRLTIIWLHGAKSISSGAAGTGHHGRARAVDRRAQRPMSEIYIYDEFARSFQRTRSILSIRMACDARRPPSLAMIGAMSEKRQPSVIGSLPSTRPHRRSGKRAAPATAATTAEATVPASAMPAAKPKPAAAAKPRPASTGEPGPTTARPVRTKPAAARTQAADRSRARTQAAARAQRGRPSGGQDRPGRPPDPARDPSRGAPAPAPASPGALQTALEAAAELTEIGLRASARALRVAVSRLPKP